MKIIGLKADGFKNLKAVEMEFKEKGFTFIKGNNEQGKTSILDCIEYLFKGKSKINNQTIGHDKDKISAELDVGEYIIKRIQTEKSDRLEIKDKKGFVKSDKPQQFLDSLINDLTFNPFPFLNKSSKEKLKFMMDFLKIDFTELDREIHDTEVERLYLGRQGKELGKPVEVEKAERVNVVALMAERDEIMAFNQEQESKKHILITMIDDLHIRKHDIETIKQKLRFAEGLLEAKEKDIEAYTDIESTKPINEVQEKINESEEVNKKAEQYDQYVEHKKRHEILLGSYDIANTKIKKLTDDKYEILKQTKTGIEGLKIKEDGLYFNDIFSENWSDSQGIKISCMLSQIMKPELKSIFIDRGESFDENTLKQIEDWAGKNDIQCIITKVESIPDSDTEIPENTYYITEGMINGKE